MCALLPPLYHPFSFNSGENNAPGLLCAQVDLISNTYLSPAAIGPQRDLNPGGVGGGLLAQHRSDIAQYLQPGAVVAAAESSDHKDWEEERRIHASLQV